ncbi:MAG: hypothetical protein IKP40_06880 [Clostridia bacterium]|nr:hypothetical protein [Clostridia bacterium]
MSIKKPGGQHRVPPGFLFTPSLRLLHDAESFEEIQVILVGDLDVQPGALREVPPQENPPPTGRPQQPDDAGKPAAIIIHDNRSLS